MIGLMKNIEIKKELFGIRLLGNYKTDKAVSEGVNVTIAKNSALKDNITYYSCNMSENLLELNIANLGNFKVESGNQITITHNTDIAPEETLVFLYGSCMGGILYQRGIIPLHGSAVLTEKGAVLFLGVSGTGKSTTAAALAERGYPIISDDISAIRLEGSKAVLIPSKADLKLWKNSFDLLNKSTKGLKPISNKFDKYYLPIEQMEQNSKESYEIYKIYILNIRKNKTVEFSNPIKGDEKFFKVTEHSYRSSYIEGMNKTEIHFMVLGAVLNKAEVKEVYRPEKGALSTFIDKLEADF